MGREVRRVPADWKHPQRGTYLNGQPRYEALFDGGSLESAQSYWDEDKAKWESGDFPSYADAASRSQSYEEWAGERPSQDDYMPNWPDSERTHLMMYETTSEGTPISPAFETPEELARWLADNGASSFGSSTATYEQWLPICRGGWAPSMVLTEKGLLSGVEA